MVNFITFNFKRTLSFTLEEVQRQKLRKGFTTGTCATASAKAALLSIINQEKVRDVDVILPKGDLIKKIGRAHV